MSRKRYAKKEKSSKSTYIGFFEKLIKAGKNFSTIKRIPLTRKGVKSFNKMFGTHLKKISSLKAKKYLINQIANDINPVISEYIEKNNITSDNFKTFIFNEAYKLLRVKKELIDKVNKIDYIPLKKEGQYGVYKITDLKDEHEYFIKYHDEKSFNKRLNDLKTQYKIKTFMAKLLGIYMYKTYIEEEFKKRLENYQLI
ncbi:MAG: hypothetical protein ACFFAO_02205 [Candidatus Hermodarchaeota archaeon]